MKANLLLAAAVISLIGCQKTEVQNHAQTAISFSAQVGKGTKAPVSGIDYPTDVPFGVFAYALTSANWSTSSPLTNEVMNKVEISYQSSTWKATTGNYFWPTNANTKLSFFAYSPKAATPAPTFTSADGVTFTDYVNDGSTDLMYASATDKQSGAVSLAFSHATAQVLFTVKRASAYEGVTIKVTSIKFNDVNSKGTFKAQGAAWTSIGTPVDTYVIYDNATGQNATAEQIAIGSALVMIPQTSAAMTFTIVYEVSGTGVATETVTKTIAFGNNWERNQKISYNLTISLNEITFTPTVTNWDAATDTPLTVE